VELIDFRYFHKVPNEQGKLTLERCTSDDAVPSRNSRCRWCTHTSASIRERFFGGHKVWEMHGRQFDQIDAANDLLGQTCIHVDEGKICGKRVYIVGYNCPACGEEVLTDRDLQTRDEKDIVQQISDPEFECPHCKGKGFLVPQSICDSEAHEPKPATVFDTVMTISCTGEEKTDKRGKKRVERNYSFAPANNFTHIYDDLDTHCKGDEPLMEKLVAPWDLAKRYRPERVDATEFKNVEDYVAAVLQKQSEVLGIDNPFKASRPADSRPFAGTRSFRR